MIFRTSEYRVGVVGLFRSGKTVFLTSLINHLKEHDPEQFRLGDGPVRITRFRERPTDRGWGAFPYQSHRTAFVDDRDWPRKTCDRSQFICTFERSDWRVSDVKLKLYDLPGERIADAVIAGMSYPEWSDHLLKVLGDDPQYRVHGAEYLDLLDRPETPFEQLLGAYKRSLARLVIHFKPYVSPSSFLLDARGRVNRCLPGRDEPEEFPCGLEPGCEFIPLPAAWRDGPAGLAKPLANHYDAYRRQMVLPVIGALKSCHALIVLVDVTMLLAGGPGMFNDNRQLLIDLLDILQPGQSALGKTIERASAVLLPHSWRPGGITRVAFVASKLDKVPPADRDSLTALLRQMLERPVRDYKGLQALFANCSAVVSTRKHSGADGRLMLEGEVRDWDENGKLLARAGTQAYPVSALPAEWPADWAPGQYAFPDVYPRMPPRWNCPPEQVNLDKIFDFVMR